MHLRALSATLFVALALSAVTASSGAQDDSLDVRLERIARVKPADARAFFAALRRGLANNDVPAVCALVAYPLRQTSGPVASADACAARYDDIFTVAVRRAVGRAQFDELFAAPTGVVVGFGELWFGLCTACPGGGLRITHINGAGDGSLKPPAGKALMACAMAGPGEGRWATLTADGEGGAELRIWDPQAGLYATSTPAIRLKSLDDGRVASPRCAFRTHTFADARTSYSVVSEPMCAELDDRIPPMGTVGVITRATGGGEAETIWCIQ